MELTNNIRKTVASLDDTRHRRSTGLFKVEGMKMVEDTIGCFTLRWLLVARSAADAVGERFADVADRLIPCTRADLERMTSLTTPREIIAVYEIPDNDTAPAADGLMLALDDIRDPGNLGTIIRTAGWMGIRDILCSRETADAFNPKVLQSTMGAIARVRLHYCDLPATLRSLGLPVYGTFLNGDNIYTAPLTADGIIVIGNEGHGISPEVEATVSHRITIPAFGPDSTGESLNAAIAAAITMAEFRRRSF